MAIAVARVTVGNTAAKTVENYKVTTTDVTLDDSYPTGGEALTAANLGLSKVVEADCEVRAKAATVNNAYYIASTSKLVVNAAAAEVSNATDLSSVVVRVRARGY